MSVLEVTTVEQGASGIGVQRQWYIATHSTMYRTVLTTKNYLAPNVNCTELGNSDADLHKHSENRSCLRQSHLGHKLQEGGRLVCLYLLLNPLSVDQCLAHSSCSVNMFDGWILERMTWGNLCMCDCPHSSLVSFCLVSRELPNPLATLTPNVLMEERKHERNLGLWWLWTLRPSLTAATVLSY